MIKQLFARFKPPIFIFVLAKFYRKFENYGYLLSTTFLKNKYLG